MTAPADDRGQLAKVPSGPTRFSVTYHLAQVAATGAGAQDRQR
ncbi:hypothetical protein [Novosphingobium sp. ZW T3_23]